VSTHEINPSLNISAYESMKLTKNRWSKYFEYLSTKKEMSIVQQVCFDSL